MNETKRRDRNDWLGMCLLIILALFYLNSIGCAPRPKMEYQTHRSHGPCWNFAKLEKSADHKPMCGARKVIREFSVFCTLQKGHKNEHHQHGLHGDCYWVFE